MSSMHSEKTNHNPAIRAIFQADLEESSGLTRYF